MFEVPRNLLVSTGRVGIGAMLLAAGAVPCWYPGTWHLAAPLVILGLAIVAANARVLLVGAPLLRATRGGLWFGGGDIVPWRDIAKVYDAGRARETAYGATWTRELGIAFRRRGAILDAPWWLWLAALPSGRAVISLDTVEEPTVTVVARLEAMRASAIDSEPEAPTAPPPRARVVRR